MRRTAFFLISICLFLGAAGVLGAQETPATQGKQIGVAILDFSYADTSGEQKDMTADHRKWLAALASGLRTDLAHAGGYRIVTPTCRPEPCALGSTPLDELLRASKEAGAELLVMGAVHKESTLLQWAKVTGVNVDDKRVVFDKLFTFRGDSEEAWARAEAFIARELVAAAASESAADQKPPVKLAVFGFELLDVSGGAGVIPKDPIDAEQLRLASEEARRLIQQSGRYTLVDTSGVDDERAKAHELHDCGGCDAAIAAKLGADQSLLGVVTRVTRTDYNVTFTLRDAHSGKVIRAEQTDLRSGANYSWSRGAASLIKDKFLAK
ncbi:MAG TPA: DUF2380 domain-containing protein [Roseiarcus sp.]|jgi:hypothetical protein|nr:DUF2380 domain-containing protein [Roseiarcus sp.]